MTEFEKQIIEKMGVISHNMNVFKSTLESQNKSIEAQKTVIEAQNKEIANLKTHVATQLSPEKLQAIGVRAVKEGTFTVSDMETFVKSMAGNFDKMAGGFEHAYDLIEKEGQKTRSAIPSSVGARGMFS